MPDADRSFAVPALVGVVVLLGAGFAVLLSPVPWTLTMDTGNVFIGQTVPVFRAWMAGQVPEWSDLLAGGFPLLADSTTAGLYPPHLLAYAMTRDVPLRFFDAAFALHLGLFAAGSTWLVRTLGAGPGAGALAGLLAALSPFAHYCGIAFFPVLGAQAWWPFTFVAAEHLSQPATPVLGRAMALGWIALAAQVLVGVPEQATYCAIVAGCWLLTRRSGLALGARMGRLVVLGAGAAALAAPQLLATLLYIPSTRRSDAVVGDSAAIVLSDPLRLLVAGTGVMGGLPSFFGIVALGLSIVAVIARRPRAAFLASVAAIAFLLSLGSAGGLQPWLQRIPPFDHFRSPLKFHAFAEFAVVWTAALGVDVLRRAPGVSWRLAAAGLALAAIAERAVYVTTTLPVFAAMRARDPISPTADEMLANTVPVRARRPDMPPLPIFDMTGPWGAGTARCLGTLVGLSSLRTGNIALLPANVDSMPRLPRTPALPTLLGARYLFIPAPRCDVVSTQFAWSVVQREESFCVLENPRKVEHYELVDQATAVASNGEMLDAVRTNPEAPIPIVASPEAAAGLRGGTLAIERYAAGHTALTAMVRERGLLLVRDALVPGWRVQVNGTAVTPYPAAGLFFAVPLGNGLNRVQLDYHTPGFRAGLGVLAAWTVGVAVAARVRRRWRRP
jgi:hypothetical protein